MDLEDKREQELVQINQNIEVYKKLLNTDMPQSGKDMVLSEITHLINDIIPSLKTYDV